MTHRRTSAALSQLSWVFPALVLAAVIAVFVHRGEIAGILQLFEHVHIAWLGVACLLQVLTYVLAASVWQVALRAQERRQSLGALMMFALAMLFSNQAVPTAGLSGGFVVAKALARRGMPEQVAMSALLLGLLTTYTSFLIALAIAVLSLHDFHRMAPLAIGAATPFAAMACAITFVIFRFRKLPASWQARLHRLPIVGSAIGAIAAAPTRILGRADIVIKATLLQLAGIACDASTLGVSLLAVGRHLSLHAVFGAYVVASVASRVALVPLGIGTFEAASVAMLHAAGVPGAPALAATLIFRGFTLWLPMIPGILCARRVLRGHR